MSKPKILFLTSGRDVPSTRFRINQYLPRLREVARPGVSPCRPPKDVTQRDFRFGGWPLGMLLTAGKLWSRLTSICRGPLHDLVYIERQANEVEKFRRLEGKVIPDKFNYDRLKHLRNEAREKLKRIRPASVGQAARIAGVTPADIQLLLVHLG